MELVKAGDIIFLTIAAAFIVGFAALFLITRKKSSKWVYWEKMSWRETENYIRRTRRRHEKR